MKKPKPSYFFFFENSLEMQFNWRLVYRHVALINNNIYHDKKLRAVTNRSNNMFLTKDQLLHHNWLSLRDWLHDTDNVNGSFDMYGVFQPVNIHGATIFSGLSVSFEKIINAAHFRLMWDAKLFQ